MTDPDGPSVLAALGLDTDADYAVPDTVWSAALAVALDPDTPVADVSTVPLMDDHGTIPDPDGVAGDGSADLSHSAQHADASGDIDLGGSPDDHGHDGHHTDPGDDGTGHHGTDPHDSGHHGDGSQDPGGHDTDWHI